MSNTNEHAKNLRRTRADMLGTEDEAHYWECHAAAAEIERLQARAYELEKGYAQLQKFVDAQAEDAALWGHAQYISEAYIQRGLRGCHAFIEQTIKTIAR